MRWSILILIALSLSCSKKQEAAPTETEKAAEPQAPTDEEPSEAAAVAADPDHSKIGLAANGDPAVSAGIRCPTGGPRSNGERTVMTQSAHSPQVQALPQTSLIICSRNRPVLLNELVDSILEGQEVPTELIVVDDSDDSNEALESRTTTRGCDIRYCWNRSRGLGRANNTGVSLARYDLLVFTQDDECGRRLQGCLKRKSEIQFVRSQNDRRGVGAVGDLRQSLEGEIDIQRQVGATAENSTQNTGIGGKGPSREHPDGALWRKVGHALLKP